MSARDEILSSIGGRIGKRTARPPHYVRPPVTENLLACFADSARAQSADVRFLRRMDDVPDAVAEMLRARNLAAAVHFPPGSPAADMPWGAGISLLRTPPGPNDIALAFAPLGIAETGTLVYPAGFEAPASWHFRPAFEIAVLRGANIVARLEDALAPFEGRIPSTLNLVTGPSRTGDIEQTLELGAHGPKELAILVVAG